MNASPTICVPNPIPHVDSPEERLADLRRRRADAADVIAETLLDLWLRERRARGAAASANQRTGGRSG